MKISQREARLLKKRVAALEGELRSQRERWLKEWPNSPHIYTVNEPTAPLLQTVKTARALRHAVVVTENSDSLFFYGCPIPEPKEIH